VGFPGMPGGPLDGQPADDKGSGSRCARRLPPGNGTRASRPWALQDRYTRYRADSRPRVIPAQQRNAE